MKKGSGNKNLKIVELGARIPQDKLFEGSCHHDHGDGATSTTTERTRTSGSVRTTRSHVEGIRDELKEADPAHAAGYDHRAAEYVAKLREVEGGRPRDASRTRRTGRSSPSTTR